MSPSQDFKTSLTSLEFSTSSLSSITTCLHLATTNSIDSLPLADDVLTPLLSPFMRCGYAHIRGPAPWRTHASKRCYRHLDIGFAAPTL
ncbi:hypothetical protein GGP41_000407 [Bipolaris sorokiniana]|uniref:Uncharacterized protein n=1 Tax=Cochliobolus sativus TaxID=45130 RepID=A0A8H6DYX5_COCSA|nr:hypothetical protein GGP41_000407 [Bipolaris sorokiniana]